MVDNPEIRKSKLNARELEAEISKLQQESGYPYVLNIDTANRSNPVNGRIIMSNLCSEILQVSSESAIFDNQEFESMGTDISCNLGSTNITNLMASPDFGKSVRIMTRALTQVSDNSSIETVPSVKHGNDLYHSFGLGAMDMHGFLAKNRIHYGSPESIEFTSVYFLLLNYWTLFESNQIAKERGQSFHEFDKSTYATGEYFDSYTQKDWSPKHNRVQELFAGIFIPTQADWEALKESVRLYGVYSAYRLAVAPTGSISYVNEATSSIHPIIQRIEERQEKKTGNTYYPAPYLSDETIPYYTSAYDTDMRLVIDLYAAAQQHIDQGASLTLYFRSTIPAGLYEWKGENTKQTTRDLTLMRHYAHQSGIKTLYYVRTFTDDEDEIGANVCENCSI
jgi:ribonucleoside-diphosphate reductase alpha chain